MNPLDIEGVTFEDMCDWLMLSEARVKRLIERQQITVIRNLETRENEYCISNVGAME